MKTEQAEQEKLQEIGKHAFESIAEMVAALDVDYDRLLELKEQDERTEEEAEELAELEKAAGDCESLDDAEQRIIDDPLSIQVRSGWCNVGAEMEAEEYCILLSTGGPATRIIGDLNRRFGEPETATLQAQDWFTSWQDYREGDEETLIRYASRFLDF